MMTVNEMQAEVNRMTAMIEMEQEARQNVNELALREAVMNLLDGCGKNFYLATYYAPNRVYLDVPGIKNVRFNHDKTRLFVKITAPSGNCLPDAITVRGVTYPIEIWHSKNYCERIDY